jgi:hypothetical protein
MHISRQKSITPRSIKTTGALIVIQGHAGKFDRHYQALKFRIRAFICSDSASPEVSLKSALSLFPSPQFQSIK